MQARHHIQLCLGSACFAHGSQKLIDDLKAYIANHGLEDSVTFSGTHCTGKCKEGPSILFDGIFISGKDQNALFSQLNDFLEIN
jgi:NADH:ubiquinone oxidoreductase subunit E